MAKKQIRNTTMTVACTTADRSKVDAAADAEGRSRSTYILRAVMEYIDKKKRKATADA